MKNWGMYDSHSHLYSRQYFHSQTCLPVTHAQLDYDSDNDDVSAKEKLWMKLWNRHVRSYKIYADHNIPKACEELVRTCGKYLKKMSLRPNLLLHLFNLWDNGLVNSGDIMRTMQLYDTMNVSDENPKLQHSKSTREDDAVSGNGIDAAIQYGSGQLIPPSSASNSKYKPLDMPSIWSAEIDQIILDKEDAASIRENGAKKVRNVVSDEIGVDGKNIDGSHDSGKRKIRSGVATTTSKKKRTRKR